MKYNITKNEIKIATIPQLIRVYKNTTDEKEFEMVEKRLIELRDKGIINHNDIQ